MKVAILFVAVAFAIIAHSAAKVKFQIKSTTHEDLFIATKERPGKEELAHGGFLLRRGATKTVYVEDKWAGRIWGKRKCTSKAQCAEYEKSGVVPPATYIDISLKTYGSDFYSVDLVGSPYVLASIEPVNGTGDGSTNSCKKAESNHIQYTCNANFYNIKFYDKLKRAQET